MSDIKKQEEIKGNGVNNKVSSEVIREGNDEVIDIINEAATDVHKDDFADSADKVNADMGEEADSVTNKKGFINNIRTSFTGRKFRSGVYTTVISTLVIVLVLVVNLIVSELDLKMDLSIQDLYTLTDSTEDYVDGLEEDITLYYLVETGNEDTVIGRIAEKYDSLSDRVNLVYKDPTLYPRFAEQYVEDEISINSFIVVNDVSGRARYVDSSELVISEFDYNTLQNYTTGIDVEGKLTAAIQYVTDQNLPVLYVTSGHAEPEAGEIFTSLLEKMNVTVSTLSTLTTQSIPEDCDILMINSPETDFTEDEIGMIKEYMAAGGNVVLVMDYLSEGMVNLKSLLDYYGLKIIDGIVCEGDTSRYARYPNAIVPEVVSHEITDSAIDSKRYVITPIASGLVQLEGIRSSLSIKPLLVTSETAYSKVNIEATTMNKEAGDIDGPFYIGLVASDTYDKVTSNLVVYTSSSIFGDTSLSGYGNEYLLKGTVNYLAADLSAVSVRSRSIIPEAIQLTEQQRISWGALTVLIVPILILAAGIVINVKRRRR